ncbi:hypothetical protein [Mesorhizobium sp. AA22]|uniref:hypothetical protein n=1 Tax=Mesorhizobium sp. AA22 TaxID=1854057 RepID=UPI0012EAFEAE|nr:hypothetical protein [Mesorhizobium sp. AA22]QIA21507.1 hypothetical protein A9K68_006590 [Mesorhizobium sp. AA22]
MTTDENPFKRDEQGKIKSITAISNLIRADPRRAIEMCKAAGESLDAWFPANPR